MTYKAPAVLKSEVAKCRCRIEIWSTFFAWNQLHITMTFSISTCRKLKFIHRTRSFVTQSQGPFQELFNRTRCTTCNRFYFLSSVVTFDAFYISNQKQKCTACVEIWCSLFLQNSNNKDLQKFAKNWKHSHVPINEKIWLKATQMNVIVLCLSARYMEFSKFIEKYDA